MNDLEYIAENLSDEDILCQISEEASELAQAALKLRRVIVGTNPTPVSEEEATDSLIEEYADTITAFEVWAEKIGYYYACNELREVIDIIDEKSNRWAQRIREAEKNGN